MTVKPSLRGFTVNEETRLYVLQHTKFVTCLGFDECYNRSVKMREWLSAQIPSSVFQIPERKGTFKAYAIYSMLLKTVERVCRDRHIRCDIYLTPQLTGLENSRVEVIDCYDNKRRFWVGKSTGFMPCHLEIARRDSTGGPAVGGTPFKSIRIISQNRHSL
jgi:hypothetical protein